MWKYAKTDKLQDIAVPLEINFVGIQPRLTIRSKMRGHTVC